MLPLAIRTIGLSRLSAGRTALDGVDLEVPRGSVYGLLGPSGAGKTLTIRLLLGLIRPSAGSITVLGGDPWQEGRGVYRRVGALVDAPSLYPHLSGRENLEVARRLLGAPRSAAGAVLALVGLEAQGRVPVAEYTLPMRQRLGLALALLGAPELVVLDEPTNGLDPAGVRDVRELLRRVPGELGTTVLFSSHLLSEVEHVATDVGILRGGRLLFQGPVEALQASRQPRAVVRVDEAERALRLLRDAGWSVHRRGAAIEVELTVGEDAARLNTLLVLQGVRVFQLAVEQASLEDVFLRMIGQSAAEAERRTGARAAGSAGAS